MTERQREVYEAVERLGTKAAAARELGIDRRTVSSTYLRAKSYIDADPGIKASMDAVNTGMTPKLAWIKTKNEDGASYSVLLKPDDKESEEEENDFIDRVKERLEGMTHLPMIEPPKQFSDNLANVIPIFDAHLGMKTTSDMTGKGYDLGIATRIIRGRFSECIRRMPRAKTTYIINGGDFTHADDDNNVTPIHKHPLDVDGRHYETIDASVEVLSEIIEKALQISQFVEVHSIPGNHDPKTWIVIMFALAERFAKNERVYIRRSPVEFFAFTFGFNLICGHHGHKRQAKDLVMFFASEYPNLWGSTRHRTMFTGHYHRLKAEDFPGMTWECVRPFTFRDHYAASTAYPENSELQGITYHSEKGEISRVRVRGD
jgi:hypothetical protein